MINDPSRGGPRFTRSLAVLAIAAVALGTAACGDDKKDSAGSADTARSATAGTAVTIKDFNFSPTALEAKAGATITVKNDDSTAHTLTADDKSVDTGELAGGATGEITLPDKTGTLAYHCEIHDFMKGSFEVTA